MQNDQRENRWQDETGNGAQSEDLCPKFKEKNKLDSVGDIEQEIMDIDDKLESVQKQVHDLREKQQELIRRKDSLNERILSVKQQLEDDL